MHPFTGDQVGEDIPLACGERDRAGRRSACRRIDGRLQSAASGDAAELEDPFRNSSVSEPAKPADLRRVPVTTRNSWRRYRLKTHCHADGLNAAAARHAGRPKERELLPRARAVRSGIFVPAAARRPKLARKFAEDQIGTLLYARICRHGLAIEGVESCVTTVCMPLPRGRLNPPKR